jgi:hypothetical protein
MIVDLAHARGWLVHHDRGDYRQCIAGDPGFPDLVLGRGESVLFFEVKSEKGKVTAAQREWSYNLSSHFVVRPSDWPHVQAVLK